MSIFEQILRQSATYTVALVAGRLASILLLPLYTRYLTTADYGLLDLLSSAQLFFELLVGVRLADGLFYYFAKAAHEEPGAERRVVSSAFYGSLGFGVVTLVAGWAGAEAASRLVFQTAGHAKLIRIVCLGVAFLPLSEIGLGYLRATDRAGRYVVVSIGRLMLTGVLAAVFLAGFGMRVEGVLWAAALGTGAQALWSGADVVRRNGLGFSPGLLWAQVRYAAPVCLSGIMMTFIHYGDRFFLQRHVPMSEIGLYGLAYKLGMVVSFVSTPFFQYWNSQMFNILRTKGGEAVYVRLLTYLTLALQAAALAVTVFAGPALAVLASAPFRAAAGLAPYIAATYVIRGVGEQLRSIFSVQKRTGLFPVVTAVGVTVCAVLYAVWIPRWGVYGAVGATGASFASMGVAGYILGQRLQRYRFEWGRIAALTVVTAAAGGGFLLLAPRPVWAQLALGAAVMAAWCGVLVWMRFFTPDERDWALRKLRGLRAAG